MESSWKYYEVHGRKHICGHAEDSIDREATIELYRKTITAPGADSCDCLYCRNFAKQRQDIYPDEFKTLLVRLGADPTKSGSIRTWLMHHET